MGEAELTGDLLLIRAVICYYGDAASEELVLRSAREIATMWNAPAATVRLYRKEYLVQFEIQGQYLAGIDPEMVWYNYDPRFNFFRVEEEVEGNISYVDGNGSNTGFFKRDNLLKNSTTAAHEFGHTLGLPHPADLDIRGKGVPGIMYPRGTICDPSYQYDPEATPGKPGGTLNPIHRIVRKQDIENLRLHLLSFDEDRKAIVGEFSNLFHAKG